MKVLIYGAGVIGSIFAGKLASGGHDVTLLARGNRLEALRSDALMIRNIRNKITERDAVSVIDKLRPDDEYDYILVTMQYRQIDTVLPILSENKSVNVVVCVNNPNGYNEWTIALGARLMIGFPAAGGEINNNVTEYYISSGFTRFFQTTTFGEPDGSHSERLMNLVRLFNKSGIPSVASYRMDNWQKCHLAVVSPIAAAILKNGGNIKTLSKHLPDIRQMILATRQGFGALKELGFSVEPKKLNFYYMPIFLLTCVFSIVFRTKIAEFSMAKHTNNAKAEMHELQTAFEALIENTEADKKALTALSQYLTSDIR